MLYVVHGEDDREALTWLSKKKEEWVPEAWRSFNFHRVDARKISLDEFQAMLYAYPMGSTHRVVVVEGLEKSELLRSKELPSLFLTLPSSTIVVLWFVPGPTSPKKLPFGAGWKEVLKLAEFVKASSDGSLSQGEGVFALLDALGERKAQGTLLAIKKLLLQGEPPLRLLAALANHLRVLWQIKILDEGRKGLDEISKRLGIHPYRVTKGIKQARNFKKSEFPRFLEWLTKADLNLKTGRNEPDHLLILLLLRICQAR